MPPTKSFAFLTLALMSSLATSGPLVGGMSRQFDATGFTSGCELD